MFIPRYDEYVYAPSQKAAIVWDGTTETMILSTKITMEQPQDVAWVVPIQSKEKPEVSAGDIGIFYNITLLLSPAPRSKGWLSTGFGGMSNELGLDSSVEILEEKKVDIYDIAILRATNASVLLDWLNSNGFSTSNDAEPILDYYVNQDDFYFIANRINLENVYSNFSYTQNDSICTDMIIDKYQMGYWYRLDTESLIDELFSDYMPKSLMYACANVSLESVKVLYDLRSGISTPLKIVFEPSRPFYPMKMTSLNDGDLIANVYFFSTSFYNDSSSIMLIDKMVQVNENLKKQLGLTNELYLTSMTFAGDTKELTTDSIFVSAQYDPSKDPYYVDPMETIVSTFGIIIIVPFLILYLWPIFLLPLLLGGIVGWLLKSRNRNVKLIALAGILVSEFIVLFALFGIRVVLLPFILIGAITCVGFAATILKLKMWKRVLLVIISLLVILFGMILSAGMPGNLF